MKKNRKEMEKKRIKENEKKERVMGLRKAPPSKRNTIDEGMGCEGFVAKVTHFFFSAFVCFLIFLI